MNTCHLGPPGLAFALLILAVGLQACSGRDPVSEGGPASGDSGDGVIVSGSQIRIDMTTERGAALADDGGFVFVDEARTIVVNAGGTIRAFSSICPSDACDVNHVVTEGLRCACDGSTFNTFGLPVQGAARTALERYTVTRSGDIVTVARTSSDPAPNPDPEPVPPPYGY